MRENTDQKNSEYGRFLRSDLPHKFCILLKKVHYFLLYFVVFKCSSLKKGKVL